MNMEEVRSQPQHSSPSTAALRSAASAAHGEMHPYLLVDENRNMPQSEKNDMPTLKNLLSPARSMPQCNESRRRKLRARDAEPVGPSKPNNPGPVVHPY